MLHAQGSLVIGSTAFSSHIFFERAFRGFSVERRGLVWDSRFAPCRNASGRGITSVYLVLEGSVVWSTGESIQAGSFFIATESQLDGENGARTHTLRAEGEPFRALELRIDPALCVDDPSAAPLTLAASTAVVAAAERVLASHDAPSMRVFLNALVTDGILNPEVKDALHDEEPENFVRCWSAIRNHYLRIETAPSLQDLADGAGVSLRQMSRDVEALLMAFPIGGDGFREYVTDVRLRWATVLLSAPALAIGDIANAAGYGSVQALGRAFRDAGLPSPGAVRRALCASPTKLAEPIQGEAVHAR